MIEDDLIRDEGLKLKPYKCTAGKTTIGVGRNLDDVGITNEEALELLRNDIMRCMKDLDKNLPWWRTLTENRQSALVNLCFNLGIGGLLGFKNTLEYIRTGQYDKAAENALQSKWAAQVGDRAKRIAELIRKG